MARVKVLLKEVVQLDENSVGVMLDFDKVSNPGKVVETIKKAKEYHEGSLTFWQVIGIIIKIWNG